MIQPRDFTRFGNCIHNLLRPTLFVSNSLGTGRRINCLPVADDFSHECVDIAVDWETSGEYVTRMLGRAALFPKSLRLRPHPALGQRCLNSRSTRKKAQMP